MWLFKRKIKYDLPEDCSILPIIPHPALYNVKDDIVKETKDLFLLHLKYEVKKNGLKLPKLSVSIPEFSETVHSRTLRELANMFVESPLRRSVYEQVQNIDLESLRFSTFHLMLINLFQDGGITRERILVLFYFCTDLIIRVLQEKCMDIFDCVFFWTTWHINGRLSPLIQDQGGWEVVLSDSVRHGTNFCILGLSVVGVIAICFSIRKLLK